VADTDSTRDVRSKDANTGDVNSDDTLGDSQHLERIQPLEKRALLRDVIYKTLLDLIRSGQYRSGDRLPRSHSWPASSMFHARLLEKPSRCLRPMVTWCGSGDEVLSLRKK
jgi:hypothetical protein